MKAPWIPGSNPSTLEDGQLHRFLWMAGNSFMEEWEVRYKDMGWKYVVYVYVQWDYVYMIYVCLSHTPKAPQAAVCKSQTPRQHHSSIQSLANSPTPNFGPWRSPKHSTWEPPSRLNHAQPWLSHTFSPHIFASQATDHFFNLKGVVQHVLLSSRNHPIQKWNKSHRNPNPKLEWQSCLPSSCAFKTAATRVWKVPPEIDSGLYKCPPPTTAWQLGKRGMPFEKKIEGPNLRQTNARKWPRTIHHLSNFAQFCRI